MPTISSSPPRAPPIKYVAPLGTRWAKEKAAAGGSSAFDLPTDPRNIGPWILGECVGKGASGRVKIAKHKRTGQLAAVKILPIAPLVNSRASLSTQQAKFEKQRLGIDREITMMKLMNHPNILRIYDVYEGDHELFLVLEYVEGGELFDFLVNKGKLPPNEALQFFKQIIYGLNYAHTFSIIHRDLKPENILIASIEPPVLKIADWGMAAFAPPSLQLETSCGSPHYASPEIVNGEKYQGNATDIWSCGVILFALLTGRLPFDDKNVRTLLSKVKSGKYDMPPWIDPLAKDLVSRMLVVEVKKRITIPEVLAHPWLLSPPALPSSKSGNMIPISSNPPLPPSPSTLARPMASPSLIDPELLTSLRVIWGRHTDPHGDSIKRDLCSPAGQGVHAKAFYFLLAQYRGESGRAESVIPSIGSSKFESGRELNIPRLSKKPDPDRLLPSPVSSRAALPALSKVVTATPPSMSRSTTSSSSRERPASPIGPRAPPSQLLGRNKEVPRSIAHTTPRAASSLSQEYGSSRPLPPKRGITYSHPMAIVRHDTHQRTVSSVQFPETSSENGPQSREVSRPTSPAVERRSVGLLPTFDPPRPLPPKRQLSQNTVSNQSIIVVSNDQSPASRISPAVISQDGNILVDLPLLTAPKTTNLELQKTMDEITEKVNGLVAMATADNDAVRCTVPDKKKSLPPLPSEIQVDGTTDSATLPHAQIKTDLQRQEPSHSRRVISRGATGDNKENSSLSEDGWSYVTESEARGAGIGLGMTRDVAREMGNIVHLGDGVTRAKTKKEKREKPTSHDTVNYSRRATISVLASPIALMSAGQNNMSADTGRLVTSPVISEFKGWFSNLFSWKNHQSASSGGVLYSSDDFSTTRIEVGRFLANLGVIVEPVTMVGATTGDLLGILRCRVDENTLDAFSSVALKPVKFRVEFLSAPGPRQTSPFPQQISHCPATPTINASNLSTPNPSATPRVRTSFLTARSTTHTPASSPYSTLPAEFPPGCSSAIMLVHEKGSASAFRVIWRKMKEAYPSDGAAHLSFSPAITNSPMAEPPQRLVL